MSVHPGWPEDLGPLRVPAGVVTVRPVKLRDAAVWSRLRIRDREQLEPWEPTGESPWDARNHITVWQSLCGNLRSEARQGRNLHLVIAIDGKECGQVNTEKGGRGPTRRAWEGSGVDSQGTGGGGEQR